MPKAAVKSVLYPLTFLFTVQITFYIFFIQINLYIISRAERHLLQKTMQGRGLENETILQYKIHQNVPFNLLNLLCSVLQMEKVKKKLVLNTFCLFYFIFNLLAFICFHFILLIIFISYLFKNRDNALPFFSNILL